MNRRLSILMGGLALLSIVLSMYLSMQKSAPVNAIVEGDISRLARIVSKYPKAVTREHSLGRSQCWTLLQFAIANRNTNAMGVLLAAGAKVGNKGKNSDFPIIMAVRYDCIECVKILLDAGADLEVRDISGRTALFSSVKNPTIAALLLERGARCDVRDNMGDSLLSFAAQFGTPQAFLVLSNGCNSLKTP